MTATAEVKYLQPVQFEQIETRFDAEFGVYWAMMNPRPRPCFNPQLLHELGGFIDGIINAKATMYRGGTSYPINYAVLSSKSPGVFNLGGDLALFRSAIVHRDRAQLEQYARLCVDDLYPWNRNFDLPVTTISLVQGSALGGGFEAALASSVVIAEESSRMGFPEVLFNLFPGMGAYSFLQRKVGRRVTDDLITSGNTYSARELYDMGVVDVITPDGTGEAAVYSYVRKHARGGRGRRAFEQVRREFEAVTREELSRVTDMWVDAAIKLEERDLKMMDRLVRAQQRTALENTGSYDPDAPPSPGRLAAVGGGDD
jgi:DSF synthase